MTLPSFARCELSKATLLTPSVRHLALLAVERAARQSRATQAHRKSAPLCGAAVLDCASPLTINSSTPPLQHPSWTAQRHGTVLAPNMPRGSEAVTDRRADAGVASIKMQAACPSSSPSLLTSSPFSWSDSLSAAASPLVHHKCAPTCFSSRPPSWLPCWLRKCLCWSGK